METIRYRKPTTIEQNIIEKTIKSQRNGQVVLLLLWLILSIVLVFLIADTIKHFHFMHLFLFLLLGGLILAMLSSWFAIKGAGIKNSCLVYIEKGDWNLVLPENLRSPYKITVNDKNIFFPFKKFYREPKVEKEFITFEYVKIFEFPPMFMDHYMFVAINDRFLNEKDL